VLAAAFVSFVADVVSFLFRLGQIEVCGVPQRGGKGGNEDIEFSFDHDYHSPRKRCVMLTLMSAGGHCEELSGARCVSQALYIGNGQMRTYIINPLATCPSFVILSSCESQRQIGNKGRIKRTWKGGRRECPHKPKHPHALYEDCSGNETKNAPCFIRRILAT
jgi:hypothetical protein